MLKVISVDHYLMNCGGGGPITVISSAGVLQAPRHAKAHVVQDEVHDGQAHPGLLTPLQGIWPDGGIFFLLSNLVKMPKKAKRRVRTKKMKTDGRGQSYLAAQLR